MVWNVHPHFVRSSSGFVAAEGKKELFILWVCSANSWANPAQSFERQEMGPVAGANLLCCCFQIRPDTFQGPLLLLSSFYLITYPIPTQACGIIWGTTTWIIQQTSQRNCPNWAQKPILCFPMVDEAIVRGEVSQVQLCCVSMHCQNSHRRQLLSPKHAQRKGKKKLKTLMLIPSRLVGSWLRKNHVELKANTRDWCLL